MPRVVIDNQAVDVAAGSTLLDAARQLGLDVPALCFREGCRPNTSCMLCVMKVRGRDRGIKGPRDQGTGPGPDRLVPSCATIAEEGMCAQSETEEVRQVRRTALELLLSDHAGQCRAPCQYACPFDADVPGMIRQIATGRLQDAIATLRKDVPLAGVLARVSAEVCERGCRRGAVDEPAAIGLLKRYVADKDRTAAAPYLPACQPPSGKGVAIVGAGPAGLSAAYFLLQRGHACTLIDANDKPGGMLRDFAAQDTEGADEARLPADVLDAEIALIVKLGARFEPNTTIALNPQRQRGTCSTRQRGGRHGDRPPHRTVDELRRDYDAVLVTVAQVCNLSLRRLRPGANVSYDTGCGIFAAGDAVEPGRHILGRRAVRAAAAGKAAAVCVDQYLRGEPVRGPGKRSALRTGRPRSEEIAELLVEASSAARVVPSAGSAGLTDEQARAEALRCLHCDCRKFDTCRLRKYAELYGADGARYRGQRRRVKRLVRHPDIVYEPGKCILCGLCVQIAEQAGEPLGLTLIGRGFDVRVGVPFDESLAEALKTAARRCVEACPTGALAWNDAAACAAEKPAQGRSADRPVRGPATTGRPAKQ